MSVVRCYFIVIYLFVIEIGHAAQLVVIDVGEGQAVLLKDGAEAILVDAGHVGASLKVIQALEKYDVDSLKGIIITHLHADHASGWFRLHEAFPNAQTFYSGHKVEPRVLDDVSRWVFDTMSSLTTYREVGAGDSIPVGNCQISVIWPEDPSGIDLNANSLTLQVNCGAAKALLMADANTHVEHQLLSNGAISGPIGLLVVGHHGASDATSKELLSEINPKFSAISVNADNLRGYPSSRVTDALQDIGSNILRTDIHGDLCFHVSSRKTWEVCK